jgi:hypothetical protein
MKTKEEQIIKYQKFKCARCGKDMSKIPKHLEKYRHLKDLCDTCYSIKKREDRLKIAKQKQKKKKIDI